jgi:hypothetical protein
LSINSACDIELLSQAVDYGDGSVGQGAQTQGLGAAQSSYKVIGFAEVRDDRDARLAVDTTGFDDAPVAAAVKADTLQAGHQLVI